MDNEDRGQGPAEICVGTAGWDYPDWKGLFFPRALPKGLHPLACFSQYFDAVEVNSSFYRPPRPDYAARVRSDY